MVKVGSSSYVIENSYTVDMLNKDFRFGVSRQANGLDLNNLLVAHPLSTYFMQADEDITYVGVLSGDVLIVDRSLSPKKKDTVVVLQKDDPNLKIIRFDQLSNELEFWGVVVSIIRDIKT